MGTNWLLGGYTPFALSEGRIGYFQGLLPGDFGMHFMAADSIQTNGAPAPSIVRRFSGVAVGLPANQISSPRALTVDIHARRAVGTWNSIWFMEWSDRDQETFLLTRPATGLEDATDFRISRSGQHVAYVSVQGVVHWMPFEADETHPLTAGSHPSFDGTGGLVGHLGISGVDYIVRDITEGTAILFAGSSGLHLQKPVLSWDGTRIAFVAEDGGQLSLYMAELQD